MDGQDGFGARRDGARHCFRVDTQRIRRDINEDGIGSKISNHFGCGRESMRGGDHFIAGANANSFERQMQTGRCRIHGDALDAATEPSTELAFESLHLGTRGQPAVAQRINHFLNLVFAYHWRGERQELTINHPGYLGFSSQHKTWVRRNGRAFST